MFTPTKEELEELKKLWFRDDSLFVSHWLEYFIENFRIKYWYYWKNWDIWKYSTVSFYPRSLSDIETLIRMFNPN